MAPPLSGTPTPGPCPSGPPIAPLRGGLQPPTRPTWASDLPTTPEARKASKQWAFRLSRCESNTPCNSNHPGVFDKSPWRGSKVGPARRRDSTRHLARSQPRAGVTPREAPRPPGGGNRVPIRQASSPCAWKRGAAAVEHSPRPVVTPGPWNRSAWGRAGQPRDDLIRRTARGTTQARRVAPEGQRAAPRMTDDEARGQQHDRHNPWTARASATGSPTSHSHSKPRGRAPALPAAAAAPDT